MELFYPGYNLNDTKHFQMAEKKKSKKKKIYIYIVLRTH